MSRVIPAAILVIVATPIFAADYPTIILKDDRIRLTIHTPDSDKGFYRGTRFDRSGVVGPVEVAGHKLFAPWKDKHDPTNFDDIVGPVDEFGTDAPLGYADAKVGETFLKIGVGELIKPAEQKYRFFHNYQIAKAGTWKVEQPTKDAVQFTQEFNTASGYGYKYVKSIVITPDDDSGFVIIHELTNTGTRKLVTDVYNHNFLNVDGDPVGPNYRFGFHFPLAASGPVERFNELVKLNGRELSFAKPLDTGSVFASLTGFDRDTKPGFTVHHTKSGLTLDVTGSAPLSKVNFWGMKTTICPEPFHEFSLAPGAKANWVWQYTFKLAKK